MNRGQAPAKNGAEYDWTTGWRKWLCYIHRPGVGKSIKRGLAKRLRRMDRDEIRRQQEQD